MASPVWTYNSVGNILASTVITNGTPNSQAVDFSGVMTGQIQIENVGPGTVTAGAGLQVSIFRDFTTNNDTLPILQFTISTVASTNNWQSIELPSGKYHVQVANTDASHTMSAVITTNTLSWPT